MFMFLQQDKVLSPWDGKSACPSYSIQKDTWRDTQSIKSNLVKSSIVNNLAICFQSNSKLCDMSATTGTFLARYN